jgi:hypothetical protein
MLKPNLEQQMEPHVFYVEFDNLPGGSNHVWQLPRTSFVVPVGYYFILSNVRAIVERINTGSIRGPIDIKLSIEQAARARREFENGPMSISLFGGMVANASDFGQFDERAFPLSQIVSFQEMKRPIPYADSLILDGEFISGSLNSGAKKIGVCLIGNFCPVSLGGEL